MALSDLQAELLYLIATQPGITRPELRTAINEARAVCPTPLPPITDGNLGKNLSIITVDTRRERCLNVERSGRRTQGKSTGTTLSAYFLREEHIVTDAAFAFVLLQIDKHGLHGSTYKDKYPHPYIDQPWFVNTLHIQSFASATKKLDYLEGLGYIEKHRGAASFSLYYRTAERFREERWYLNLLSLRYRAVAEALDNLQKLAPLEAALLYALWLAEASGDTSGQTSEQLKIAIRRQALASTIHAIDKILRRLQRKWRWPILEVDEKDHWSLDRKCLVTSSIQAALCVGAFESRFGRFFPQRMPDHADKDMVGDTSIEAHLSFLKDHDYLKCEISPAGLEYYNAGDRTFAEYRYLKLIDTYSASR